MNNKYDLLALNRIPQVGPKTVQKLLKLWPNLSELFRLSKHDLIHAGLSTTLASAITRFDTSAVEFDLQWESAQSNRVLLTLEDVHYPALLKEIYDPPPVLYAEGCIDCFLQPTLSIVGTRNPSITGAEVAKQFAYELSEAGLVIVSGLARGIDAAAHQGCLLGKGKTIAVMGTGIDSIYPRQHASLAEKIIEKGLLLTEFPLKSPPIAGHFPRRNRIISGLSLSLLVVESAIRSGSLLTARLALEQNRDVLAVPGSIRNPQAAGCHRLLQLGAKLVTSVQDILEDLSIEQVKKSFSGEGHCTTNTQVRLLQDMGDELVAIDQLAMRSGRSVEEIICDLVELELDGFVKSLPGGYMRCMI